MCLENENMTNYNILIAGFGGQGIQFAGKLLTYIGMYTGLEVSLYPSYGPEMRGGTSNCGVNISSEPIASPLVVNPTELIVMNGPSLEKFESATVPGGKIFYDSTLIEKNGGRTDVTYFAVPATKIAEENGIEIKKDADLLQILKAVDINQEIPIEAFAAVAEILSYIYNKNAKD